MRTVQTRPSRGRAVRSAVLTTAAALLVLVVLLVPARLGEVGLDEIEPGDAVRLPLEPIVLAGVLLLLPGRHARLRRAVALVAGVCLGLVGVFRLLDIGFLEALNRPFDPLIDWRYAGSLVSLLRDSFGELLGTALLVGLVVLGLVLLVGVPAAVLRLAGVLARHRRGSAAVVAVAALAWGGLAVVGGTGPGAWASHDTASYVREEVARVPRELRDRREFTEATRSDPYRDVPPGELVPALRGRDVLLVFVESYGRGAVEGTSYSDGVTQVLDRGTRQLAAAGFHARSSYLTSPTFGAISWLAHATMQSGLWVDSQQRYDVLVTSSRLTLSRVFGEAGWRTVALVPANDRDWPQGEFYGFDHVYDSRNVGYRGPRFGYPTMPDQYTLDAFHRLELAPQHRRPVMAEIDLITSHAPWSRTPRMIDQAAVGDGSVYDGMPSQLPSETDIWPSPTRVREAYGHSIEYSLRALVRFVTAYGDDDLVMVVLGDHQPATIVSGSGASHDVPVSVVAHDPAVLRRISDWGWATGLRPTDDAPVWPMDAFRDHFLAAYGTEDTGAPRARQDGHG